MDLRLFAAWCAQLGKTLFEVQRVDIECYARQLEARGRARSTVARRLCTVAGFYRYAEQEGFIDRSPAVHVRRPRLDDEPHAVGLDRDELGALLVAAGLAGPKGHALIPLLALNGLRISEALGIDSHVASRIVCRVARAAGVDKHISPTACGMHAFITAALDAGVPLRDVQKPPATRTLGTTMRYDRGRQSLDRHATYIVATFVAGATRGT